MTRTIEILVRANGQTHVETRGFTGTDCRSASRFLEEALGQAMDEQLTTEFYQPAQNQQSLAARDGA